MTHIDIITIATFVFMLIAMYRFASFATRTFDAYERNNRSHERNVTHYVGQHYNRHGNAID